LIELTQNAAGVLIPLKVVPGASRDRVLGEWNGRVRICVAAPPEGGKANEAVIRLIADMLGIPRKSVALLKGSASPLKTLQVRGVTPSRVLAALKSDAGTSAARKKPPTCAGG